MLATFRNLSIIILTAGIFAAGGIMMSGCSTFGARPGADEISGMKKSPNFDIKQGKFVNRRPDIIEENMKKNFKFGDFIEWLKGTENGVPRELLPQIKPDMSKFCAQSQNAMVIWLGHSSVLLRISGKVIFFDPVFSRSASPFSSLVKRFQKPAIELSDLPEIDYVVISHDHYDHLDMKTVKFFKERKTEFVVPLGVGARLTGWGIPQSRITELDWWESTVKDNIEFKAAPAQHFSGRGLTDRNTTLWASWIIKAGKENIFFSGDSGYDIHFREIGKRFGPFDLAFIETGQYNEKWKEVHMMPEEAAQAYFDLQAKRYFPIHWGMFELSMHPWFQPALDIAREADLRNINLITPIIGEIITINKNLKTTRWWEPEIADIQKNNSEKMNAEFARDKE